MKNGLRLKAVIHKEVKSSNKEWEAKVRSSFRFAIQVKKNIFAYSLFIDSFRNSIC